MEEYTGAGRPPIRTHDQSDEAEINRKLFGGGATGQTTTTYIDADGNKVEAYTGEGSGPSIRTHDHSDEQAINEKLFGKNAPKPPSSTAQTYKYRNADGDEEEVHAGSEQPGIRTHDYTNEAEINQKLFGAGSPK